jgi:hypothetical protein
MDLEDVWCSAVLSKSVLVKLAREMAAIALHQGKNA